MIRKPAHKSGTAGQIVNDITLKDYIERKYPPEAKKLTFEEWFTLSVKSGSAEEKNYDLCKVCWQFAQENK